jgi:acyl carrier protein
VDDGMLVHQTWARFRNVLAGKTHGARVLDALVGDLPLDFFVLYSSAGVLLGPMGQGAYGAANAELDALAWARRTAGRPALSVAWGQWREGGMAARLVAQGQDVWSARGLGWLTAADGFRALERLLREDAVCAAVLPIDWGRFLSRLPPGIDPAFFRAVAPAKRARAMAVAAEPSREASVVERWKSAPSNERRELLLAHLDDRTRHVLDVGGEVMLDRGTPLKEAGLDSLMAVELRNVLTRSLGTSLPATLLFDYPSLDALANYLINALHLMPAAPERAPAAREASAAALARKSLEAVAAMTDAEAEALLLSELNGGSVSGT